MEKRVTSEGSQYSQILQLMGRRGASKPVNIELATVIEAPPNLRIKLDADSLVLEKADLIVLEHLTRHDRIVSIDYEFPKTWEKDPDIGDEIKETDSSRNNIGQMPSTPYEKYEMKFARMTFEDLLLIDDRVVVACLDDDMVYVILDRAVWYA